MHSDQVCLVCFNQTLDRFPMKSSSFVEVWMCRWILVRLKTSVSVRLKWTQLRFECIYEWKADQRPLQKREVGFLGKYKQNTHVSLALAGEMAHGQRKILQPPKCEKCNKLWTLIEPNLLDYLVWKQPKSCRISKLETETSTSYFLNKSSGAFSLIHPICLKQQMNLPKSASFWCGSLYLIPHWINKVLLNLKEIEFHLPLTRQKVFLCRSPEFDLSLTLLLPDNSRSLITIWTEEMVTWKCFAIFLMLSLCFIGINYVTFLRGGKLLLIAGPRYGGAGYYLKLLHFAASPFFSDYHRKGVICMRWWLQ